MLKDCPHPLCHRESDDLIKSHTTLFAAVSIQQEAIDILFAMIATMDRKFRASESGKPWIARNIGKLALEEAEKLL